MAKSIWTSAVLTVVYLTAVVWAFNAHVCSHMQPTQITNLKYTSVSVPYQSYSWFRGYHTKYRTEYKPFIETKWQNRIQHECCYGYEGPIDNCQPVCSEGCSGNSYCSAPQTCQCKPNYEGDDCHPICESCGKNEFCQKPGECSCNEDYKKINGSGDCVPQCSTGCPEHSFCSEPEICQCEVGYARSNESAICLPVCDPACAENSYCKEPNVCSCNENYRDTSNGQCQPVCEPECGEHSRCASPNTCECLEGYIHQENATSCQPSCPAGCPEHSSCQQPNSCECDSGYIKVGEHCRPHCPNKCPDYAQCTGPNVCECFPGYSKLDESGKCGPRCDQGCPVNAICTNPETCHCKIGYLMSPNNTCDPQCSRHCLNGRCSAPETCVCNEGYRFRENSLDQCDPICNNDCRNGDCLGPDICVCHVGYRPDNSSGSIICLPVCEKECENGNCTGPEMCTCLDGFEMTHSPNLCEPKCSQGCENGKCVAPEVCQCLSGYRETPQGCQLETTTEVTVTSTSTDSKSIFEDTDWNSITEISLARPRNCLADCQCWTREDKQGAENSDKCVRTCLDDQDKPCLDLDQCRCNQSNSSIICKEEDSNGSNTHESEYGCAIRLKAKKFPKVDSQIKEDSSDWVSILGIIAGIIATSALLGALIYCKRKVNPVRDTIYEDVEEVVNA